MSFHIIIPARYESQRLPGKVLIEVMGKPIIQYVYERAKLCGAKSVTIAVDNEKVAKIAESFGATVCLTSKDHPTGTDRLCEVVEKLKLADNDIVVNLQGDEPLMPPMAVQTVAKSLENYNTAAVATLCTAIDDKEEVLNPNAVKVVLDKNGFALYFSRAPIPWDRSQFQGDSDFCFRHLGIYAYRVKTLKAYQKWSISPLEEIEKLEQLRVLWHGEKIHVSTIKEKLPAGIDTAEDLAKFEAVLTKLMSFSCQKG